MNDFVLSLDTRMRRLRRTGWMRDLLQETRLSVKDLIWPVFVHEGEASEPVASLNGVMRYSMADLVNAAATAYDAGIPAIALFPVVPTNKKSELAEESYNPNNLACRAIAEIKKEVPNIGVIADVALDPYTSHGHDGIVRNGDVANDETVHVLCKQAVALACAGADIVAPSDMMDGRVMAIRHQLDDANCEMTAILSYAAKYASAFYGPFRDAVGSGSALKGAGKKTYQMNAGNVAEAVQESVLDIEEGADMVMVKPATLYLDVIAKVKEISPTPVFAYHVSGEYAMLKAAAEQGGFSFNDGLMENLISIKRAGAKGILTYGAMEAAALLYE